MKQSAYFANIIFHQSCIKYLLKSSNRQKKTMLVLIKLCLSQDKLKEI